MEKEQRNTYFDVFDETTWTFIGLSVILLAVVVRMITFCSVTPKQKVSTFFFTKKL